MALRLVEFLVPTDAADEVAGLLEEINAVHSWRIKTADERLLVRVLLDAHETEALSDALMNRFGHSDAFRLVLLPIEATVPPLKQADESPASAAESETPSEPARVSREELYQDLVEASQLTPIYLIMVALSTLVAIIGLTANNVAVVIGAMVIAPLLGPNIALALGTTLGDLEMVQRAVKTLGSGVVVAVLIALVWGVLFPVDPTVPEIASRIQPGGRDVVLALAAGVAGTLAFTSGVSATLVGVMVAVALLPPLATMGLLAGAGYGAPATGAAMLFLVNMTCINLAGVVTFLAQRVRPRTWWEAEKARRAIRVAVALWTGMLLVLIVLIWLSGSAFRLE